MAFSLKDIVKDIHYRRSSNLHRSELPYTKNVLTSFYGAFLKHIALEGGFGTLSSHDTNLTSLTATMNGKGGWVVSQLNRLIM